MTGYGWKDDSAALFSREGKLTITIHPFAWESVNCGHRYWCCWCVDHIVSCKTSEAPWPTPQLWGSGSLLPAPSTWLLDAQPHPRPACSPGQHRAAVVGVGAEDDVGLAGAVQKLPHRLAAELRQRPGLVLEEPLVRHEALGADELLALEAPVVGRLFAAGAKCLLACDLLVHRQPPLQALEEDVVQGLRAGTWGPGSPADGALHAGLLQASWAQRVQTRQQLGALSFCPAALAAQELELFLRGLLGNQRGRWDVKSQESPPNRTPTLWLHAESGTSCFIPGCRWITQKPRLISVPILHWLRPSQAQPMIYWAFASRKTQYQAPRYTDV